MRENRLQEKKNDGPGGPASWSSAVRGRVRARALGSSWSRCSRECSASGRGCAARAAWIRPPPRTTALQRLAAAGLDQRIGGRGELLVRAAVEELLARVGERGRELLDDFRRRCRLRGNGQCRRGQRCGQGQRDQ